MYFDTLLIQPHVTFSSVEADEASNLEIGDATFGHKPLHESWCHTEDLGDSVQVNQR
jgi:hypothetical protein